MFCKNCGAQLDGTENVCPNCGTPVEKDTPVVEQPAPADAQPVQTEPVITEVQPEAVAATVEPVMESVEPVVEQPVVTDVQPAPATPEVAPEATPVTPEAVAAVAPEPTLQSMPEPAAAPVVAPVEPAMPAQPGMPTTPVAPTATPGQEPAKKNTTTIILIAVLGALFVIAIVVVLFLFVFKKEAPATPSNNGNTPASDISTNNENRETYGGYSFEIPEGYQTEVSSEYGLMFYNNNTAVSVMVDYSHNYESYKTAVQQKYPEAYKNAFITIDGREYLGLILSDETGKKTTSYMTKATETAAFVGIVANSNFSEPSREEFVVLTKILNSAKQGGSSFAAGDSEDAGKDGIKNFTFDPNKITFAK